MIDLSEEQKYAARCSEKYARLLAGPGTGKTMTMIHHAQHLIKNMTVTSEKILILTFTRAAAYELRQRIKAILTDSETMPTISTLHSFALSSLLANSKILEKIPKPLRIADDWEERNIIQEDLKKKLAYSIRDVQGKFSLLSADWQTLTADDSEWDKKFPDPSFIGAWRKHRQILGYTLRSELVYQLKRALEQTETFRFYNTYEYILIDEYQDLNRCDLTLVKMLVEKLDASLYVAGDDDQSIYGFRYAHPEGIRRFPEDYKPSEMLELTCCMRYGKEIMQLSEYVANLDPERLRREESMQVLKDAPKGDVQILRFQDQTGESDGIARICDSLIKGGQYKPEDILILLRSDFNKVISTPIREKLESRGLPVNTNVESDTTLDAKEGRLLLAHLKLCANGDDHLAWRTVLQLRDNRIGAETISKVIQRCEKDGISFSKCLIQIRNETETSSYSKRLQDEIEDNHRIIDTIKETLSSGDNKELFINKILALKKIYPLNVEEPIKFLENICLEADVNNLEGLLKSIASSIEDIEQEIVENKINIMTMHKAKGLTASVIIIVGAEDQYIPGRQEGEKEKDEMRLLFVSLSRAREILYISYCEKRTGSQAFTGRNDGSSKRRLTRFLEDAPIIPVMGNKFLRERGL